MVLYSTIYHTWSVWVRLTRPVFFHRACSGASITTSSTTTDAEGAGSAFAARVWRCSAERSADWRTWPRNARMLVSSYIVRNIRKH